MAHNITVYLIRLHNSLFLLFHLSSAGVGRTGVFVALSIVLERMRYEGVVDMFQTVKILRTQRPAMIQTEVLRIIVLKAMTQTEVLINIKQQFCRVAYFDTLLVVESQQQNDRRPRNY